MEQINSKKDNKKNDLEDDEFSDLENNENEEE
jgi:hypothetical protein